MAIVKMYSEEGREITADTEQIKQFEAKGYSRKKPVVEVVVEDESVVVGDGGSPSGGEDGTDDGNLNNGSDGVDGSDGSNGIDGVETGD